jgi:hypothetical protein
VGNRPTFPSRSFEKTVHPHACGEQTISNSLLGLEKNAGRNSTGELPL